MIIDQHVLIWARVFEWIYPGWTNRDQIRVFLQSFFPTVRFDEVYTTLGNLGQIIYDMQLPLDDIMLAAIYVCPELVLLIRRIYDTYQNLDQHPDIDEDA